MNDLISRKWLMECIDEGWIKFDTEKDTNIYIHLVRDIAPSAQVKVEELKKIANEMGYNIIKKQKYIKLLHCKCGCAHIEHWRGIHKDDAYILKCQNCGVKAMGSTEREAKLNWNRMVSEDE